MDDGCIDRNDAGAMGFVAARREGPDAWAGVGDVEQALRRACKGYVLGVKSDHHFGSWAGKPPIAGTAQEIARNRGGSVKLHSWISGFSV